MNAQLIPLEEISADKAPAIYGCNVLDHYVDLARAEVVGEVVDLNSRKGRERIASLAAQVARSKTAVEKPGREYLKRIKELPKAIEAELREFVQKMDGLRDEVRAPLNEWQAAEDARIDKHQDAIDWMKLRANENSDLDAAELAAAITEVEQVALGEHWQEFEAEAGQVKDKALTSLRAALAVRQQKDSEQAELEKLRAEKVARDRQDEIDREAREIVERETARIQRQAQADADAAAQRERDAKSEADRRELELKLQAEQSAKRELEAQQRADQAVRDADAQAERAANAERQRQADEQAKAKREADAREADIKHKGSINRAALEAFIAGGMPEECAKQAVTLIAKGRIPSVKIHY
jgi:hypothetical protein